MQLHSLRFGCRQRRSSGQAVVEFGIVALLLVLTIGGGVDLGLLVTARQSLSAATTEAGRQAAYGARFGTIADTARYAASGSLIVPTRLKVLARYCDSSTPDACHSYCDGYADHGASEGCSEDPSGPSSEVHASFLATITVTYDSYEILTPVIRQAFVGPNCDRSVGPCYATLTSSETVIYPGDLNP